MTPAVQVIQNIDAVAALFSVPRLKILAELAEPDTAAAVARRVGLPRQQVSYHVRELEHAGLVTFVEERRKGNCVERVVQAAARSYVVSPAALGALGSTPAGQRRRSACPPWRWTWISALLPRNRALPLRRSCRLSLPGSPRNITARKDA